VVGVVPTASGTSDVSHEIPDTVSYVSCIQTSFARSGYGVRGVIPRFEKGVVVRCVAVLVYRVGVDARNQLHSWWVFVLDCSHSVLERSSVECESRVCVDWEDRG
jgi:hypothetical protein